MNNLHGVSDGQKNKSPSGHHLEYLRALATYLPFCNESPVSDSQGSY
jgi:hypothetical protein